MAVFFCSIANNFDMYSACQCPNISDMPNFAFVLSVGKTKQLLPISNRESLVQKLALTNTQRYSEQMANSDVKSIMGIWSKILNLLGKDADEMPFRKVLHHELIERKPEEAASFERWLSSPAKGDMVVWLRSNLGKFIEDCKAQTDGVDFLCCNTTNGFVVNYDECRWTPEEFQHLFDYFKLQVEEMGYQKYVSEKKVIKECTKELTVERHYLKPPVKYAQDTTVRDQMYGNVLICMNWEEGALLNIKFSATTHHGRQYTEPLDFRELMDGMFR